MWVSMNFCIKFETLEKLKVKRVCIHPENVKRGKLGENGLKKKHQLQSKLCTYVCINDNNNKCYLISHAKLPSK